MQFNIQSFKTSLSRERLKNINFLLVFLAAALVGGAIYAVPKITRPKTRSQPTTAPTSPPALLPKASSSSTTTVVYGVWRGGKAEIRAVNIDGSNDSSVALLPTNIKDVHVLSNNQLLYIAETNQQDHGQKIVIYNLTDDTTQTVAQAESGWGIDDIVVSPDKTWVAWWEVKFAPGKSVLLGGNSRVYAKQVSAGGFTTTSSSPIVDEIANEAIPIHYPLFFDGDNQLYLDSFIPNGGGWNLGLFRVEGLNLVPVLMDGEFSSDPLVSPADGKTIAFAGYDSSASPQIEGDPTGIARPVILNPNLLQTFDLDTSEKTTHLGSANGAQYDLPLWSDDGTKIAFLGYRLTSSSSSTFEGTKIVETTTGSVKSIPNLADTQTYLLSLKDEKLIWGTVSADISEPGNLGDSYSPLFSSISVSDFNTLEKKTLVGGVSLQFINAVPKDPGTPLGMTISPKTAQQEKSSSLQFASLEIKWLAEIRGNQQNGSEGSLTCTEYLKLSKAEKSTAEQLGLIKPSLCVRQVPKKKEGDSPLYLYPEKDTWVEVKIKAPSVILKANPEYKGRWLVLAKPNGLLITVHGQTFNKISYVYSVPDFAPPKSGLVTNKAELEQKLIEYARKLGLVRRESDDFVSFWSENLPDSPYYFVSHFNKETSTEIMPLEINPSPDTLIQTVMYFKPLKGPMSVEPPIFESIPKREGFVVVDWSGIIDY